MKNILIGYSNAKLENSIISPVEKEGILTDIRNSLKHGEMTVTKLEKKDGPEEQIWVRDNFFVLAGHCVLCNMTSSDTLNHDRKKEEENIELFLRTKYSNLIKVPFEIEGGDIIHIENEVFVGISERTTIEAYNYLRNCAEFKEYNFHAIKHNVLHLDCCFAVLDKMILYSGSKLVMDDIFRAKGKLENKRFVNLDGIDLGRLNTNFIRSGDKIFHGKISEKLQEFFNMNGYEVIQIASLNRIYTEGGGIRCLTQFF